MSADRCPTCDREIADVSTIGEGLCEVQASFDSKQRRAGGWNLTARKDCEITHRVDWRAKFFAAESDAAKDRDDARSWRNAIEGAKEPGDPVLRAIAELLSCTYLDAVPTPADDDMRRELAVAARVANDERRAKLGEGAVTYSEKRDAAKWRKVEPLIERLRVAADADTSDTIHVVDAAIELLAAAKEPS